MHHWPISSQADGPLTAQLQEENNEDEEQEQATPEDALAELGVRIGAVHAHHKVVQKNLLMRVESLEKKALEEEKNRNAAGRHVQLERRVSEQDDLARNADDAMTEHRRTAEEKAESLRLKMEECGLDGERKMVEHKKQIANCVWKISMKQ